MPRTRSRTRCCARGGGWRGSRAAARCARGSTGSRRTSACARSSAGRSGFCRSTTGRRATRTDLDDPLTESVWIEPYPDDGLRDVRSSPDARYEQRESVELAFIAALQHLPDRQRAVLLLRDVLGFAPAEIAEALDSTPASVYSALQRAHAAIDERLPERSQQETLRSIDDERLREVTERFVAAWEADDVSALVELLTDDAAITMPPRPSWYRGREAVAAFLAKIPMAERSIGGSSRSRPTASPVRHVRARGRRALVRARDPDDHARPERPDR